MEASHMQLLSLWSAVSNYKTLHMFACDHQEAEIKCLGTLMI